MIPERDVLRQDIKNTQGELKAYRAILGGLEALSTLPESDQRAIRLEMMKYQRNIVGCSELLEDLKRLYQRVFSEEYQSESEE